MAVNPYVNKVVVNDTTLIDLTSDTVDVSHLALGYTAHNLAGATITGTMVEATPIDVSTDAGMTAVLISSNVGKAYRFTGTTGTYTNGDIYIVESV